MSLQGGIHCSFCDKHQDDVPIIIAGRTGHICSECIAVSVNILADSAARKARTYFVRAEDVPNDDIMKIVERSTPTTANVGDER